VWQNSWGLTTRTIGVMVMVHSDDKGLVLPPMVAPVQVVIIPIYKKGNQERLVAVCRELKVRLSDGGVRVDLDERDNYNPGWKFAHWELKGVCLRVEVGEDELDKKVLRVQRRDRLGKEHAVMVEWDGMEERVKGLLTEMQADLLKKATEERDGKRKKVTEWRDFMRALDARCTALAPHCEGAECEKRIKQRSGEAAEVDVTGQEEVEDGEEQTDAKAEKLTGAAKSLCIPFDQPELTEGTQCIGCDKPAKNWTLFGRSY
jgi:prolyl-tRNA synthetase